MRRLQRLIDAIESWLLQGWDPSWFVTPAEPGWWEGTPKVKNAHQFIDLICNMSGDALVLEGEEVIRDTDDEKDNDDEVIDTSSESD